jgi:ABC-type dipeptide/oligopeptide/nickel transport system permease subunit
MLMAGMRGPGRRGKDRSRATAAVLISATVVLAVLVGVGVVAFLHSGSSSSAQGGHLKLSNKITSQLSVGLANLGRTGQPGSSGSSATLLYAGAGGLIFTPSSGGGETVPSSQQWQADGMGGGTYILLFSPTGRCLTAVGSGARASAQLAACDTGLDQRWYHPFEGTDSQGRDFWALRSASDRLCLGLGTASSGGSVVAELQKCGAGKPWPQQVMFWSAY